ncbi:TlpA family protein disulfide reductase [Dyadobacter crusticola]|uniref:TlpA family protein disulfide reductase n=1 Tax=Dyadobacter crusticola TaxID=292407 RepID=UPI00068F3D49|nr:TlpA disulfide reductase family protein [Dyadobacter crusticola]
MIMQQFLSLILWWMFGLLSGFYMADYSIFPFKPLSTRSIEKDLPFELTVSAKGNVRNIILQYQNPSNGYIIHKDTLRKNSSSFSLKINLSSPTIATLISDSVSADLYIVPAGKLHLEFLDDTYSVSGTQKIENEYLLKVSREKVSIPKIFSFSKMNDYEKYLMDVDRYYHNQLLTLRTFQDKADQQYSNALSTKRFFLNRKQNLHYVRLKLIMNYLRQLHSDKLLAKEKEFQKYFSQTEQSNQTVSINSSPDVRFYYEYTVNALLKLAFAKGDSVRILRDGTYASNMAIAKKYFNGSTKQYLMEASLIDLFVFWDHPAMKSLPSIEDLINKYSEDISENGLNYIMNRNLLAKQTISYIIQENTLLPNYLLYNSKKDSVRFYDILKDKDIVIDVWATWCGNCIESFPIIDQIKNEVGAGSIMFVKVSIDDKIDRWKKGSIKLKIPPRNSYYIPGATASSFCKDLGISALPRYILVSKDGILKNRMLPDPRTHKKLFSQRITAKPN